MERGPWANIFHEMLRDLLPPSLFDLLDARHQIPCRDGHDVRCNKERILRNLFGYAHKHRQHGLMIEGSHLDLTDGAIHLQSAQGIDEFLSIHLARFLQGFGDELSRKVSIEGAYFRFPSVGILKLDLCPE